MFPTAWNRLVSRRDVRVSAGGGVGYATSDEHYAARRKGEVCHCFVDGGRGDASRYI